MKKISLYPIFFLFIAVLTACQKNEKYEYNIGSPVINIKSPIESAHFGDSLFFNVNVSDNEIPLSTLKIQVLFTDDVVSEVTLRTKENGEYTGKIYIPFYKNVPDGVATLRFTLQNISQKLIVEDYDLKVSRADYPFLEFVTETKTYKMIKKTKNQYTLTDNLPYAIKGYIKAPKINSQGNELYFGWVNNTIELGSQNEIPFSNTNSGTYDIHFNTFTFEASPFIIAYAINGNIFSRIDDTHYKSEINITKGQEVVIDGIDNLQDWWIDPDYFTINNEGKLLFNALSGKYRITADFNLNYFAIEPMTGNELAKLNTDGTGTIWIIGEGIGKPSVSKNQVGWNTDKALALAPIGNKKYQITITGDKTIKTDNINFKFFHQKNWGGEFSGKDIKTASDLIFIGDGSNGRDSGNLGYITGKQIEVDKTYIIILDLSKSNNEAVMTVKQE